MQMTHPGGLEVSVSYSWSGACEFDPWLRWIFFPAYFCLSPLQKHVGKVVDGFGKKSCVNTGVRKPGNMCASPTAMIQVVLNPNTTNQPIYPDSEENNMKRVWNDWTLFWMIQLWI